MPEKSTNLKPYYGFRYLSYERNRFNDIIYSKIESYVERNQQGELITRKHYTPKFRIKFAGRTYSITGLIWFLLNNAPARGHIRSLSETPNSVDPRYLYNPNGELCL